MAKVQSIKGKVTTKDKVTIALVIDDENALRQVNEVLNKNFPPQGNGSKVTVLGQWMDLGEGFDIIRSHKPTIAMIGLCSKENPDVHALAERISTSLSDTQIFMISVDKDPDIMLRAMRSGVKEYLTTPIDSTELLNAIDRIKTVVELKTGIAGPRTIGMMSAKGGSGCTTVAVNLATALRLATKQKVVVVDVCGGGDVALFFNIKYRYTLKDVIENLDRLDLALLKSYTVEHSSGVHIIPSMGIEDVMHGVMDAVTKEALQFLINLLTNEYSYIILDVGCTLSKNVLEVLKLSDSIFLVLPLELAALRNARQDMVFLEEMGLLANTKLIVSRYDRRYAKGGSAISLDDVTKTLNLPIFSTIPSDYFLVSECINLGAVLVTEKPKSPIAQSFLRLAELLSKAKVPAREPVK